MEIVRPRETDCRWQLNGTQGNKPQTDCPLTFVFLEEHEHRISSFCNRILLLATLCKGDHPRTREFLYLECGVQIAVAMFLWSGRFFGMSVGGKVGVYRFHVESSFSSDHLGHPSLYLGSFTTLCSYFVNQVQVPL